MTEVDWTLAFSRDASPNLIFPPEAKLPLIFTI
jgi:hypothetical protein